MRPSGWLPGLALGVFLVTLAACDPATIFSRQSPPPPPSGPAAAPAAAPESAASRQIRALEEKVRLLERRLAALEQRQGGPAPSQAPTAPRTVTEAPPTAPVSKAPPAPPPSPPAPALASGDAAVAGRREALPRRSGPLSGQKLPGRAEQVRAIFADPAPGPKAAEARYYLGDSFYQEKKYAEARVEFNKMVLQFPNSILAPTALLRQAYSYQQTNQKPISGWRCKNS
jgi:TolA-binding protein